MVAPTLLKEWDPSVIGVGLAEAQRQLGDAEAARVTLGKAMQLDAHRFEAPTVGRNTEC